MGIEGRGRSASEASALEGSASEGAARERAASWGPTLEDWVEAYVRSTRLEEKLAPPSLPAGARFREGGVRPLRLEGPGRDPGLRVSARADRVPRAGALREASAVARLLHVFTHHEVQAAELCGWAILAFPDTPASFREGLLGILQDEVRHAAVYGRRIEELGSGYGSHAVRDWFWERALGCRTALQYVALMGLGFEGGNLEHARRFDEQLTAAGDGRSAGLVARVGREEVAHVHFAARWFSRWTGVEEGSGPDFDRWAAELPRPLTPAVLRGTPLDRERRGRAGLSAAFLDRLEEANDTRAGSQR